MSGRCQYRCTAPCNALASIASCQPAQKIRALQIDRPAPSGPYCTLQMWAVVCHILKANTAHVNIRRRLRSVAHRPIEEGQHQWLCIMEARWQTATLTSQLSAQYPGGGGEAAARVGRCTPWLLRPCSPLVQRDVLVLRVLRSAGNVHVIALAPGMLRPTATAVFEITFIDVKTGRRTHVLPRYMAHGHCRDVGGSNLPAEVAGSAGTLLRSACTRSTQTPQPPAHTDELEKRRAATITRTDVS